jgi:hypothetical protein
MPGLAKLQRNFLDFTGRHPLLIYTLFAFALIWFSQFDAAKAVFLTGHIRDTDDAMRLVQVRDWLAGQSWFDLHQYRINPPEGLLMHWSRLIDVPVAALILFFKFFTSADMAERLARLVWPALVQLSLFATVLALTLKLAGWRALFAASVLIGFNAIVSMQMEPGRIDHHDVLMLLSALSVLLTLLAFEKPRLALLAGLIASAMMAIGFETLPAIAVVGMFYFFYWLYDRRYADSLLRNFGLSFAAGTLVLYFATTPPALYQTLVCDAQSYASTILALGAGLSCAILARFGAQLRSIPQKLVAAAICSAALLTILYIYAKPCFSGPFAALPLDLREKWLTQVFEAIGLGQHLKTDFWNNLAFAGPLAVALSCAAAAVAFQKQERWRWGLLFALVGAHALLSFEHLRMLPYAILFALPAAAWCIARLREKSQAAMALLYIVSIPAVWALAVQPFATPIGAASQCGNPANYAEIAKLPQSHVLAPIDLGTFLLAHTKHAAYGAPYHRNIEGMRFVLATLYETPEKALPKLREKNIDYIVLCDNLGEQRAIDQQNPNSLATRLMKNESFKGLAKIDVRPPMHLWRVR